jgi:hypothetical protein
MNNPVYTHICNYTCDRKIFFEEVIINQIFQDLSALYGNRIFLTLLTEFAQSPYVSLRSILILYSYFCGVGRGAVG